MPHSASTDPPYLSIVAASRNDNHGGDLLFRMQTFLDALAEQCDRFRLPAELVLVEWNPPSDRPPLIEALDWPSPGGFLACRIITVPHEIHRALEHSERLPLFQMIAKNVGIRRASAPFILATNVDIVFSDEIIAFIAARALKPGVLYRADRHDSVIDARARLRQREILRQCEEGVIRIHRSSGVVLLSEPAVEPPDARPDPAAKRKQFKDRLWAITRLLAHPGRNAFPLTEHALLLLADLGAPQFHARWHRSVYRTDLHTQASGDFTLLSRADWFRLCGFAELPNHGLHMDALLCVNAAVSGIQEQCLPSKIFHIEHEGTWARETASAAGQLTQASLQKKPLVTIEEYLTWVRDTVRDKKPKFARPDWGYAGIILPERGGVGCLSNLQENEHRSEE